jgi:ADP-ribose pyrophosphatase YjhB (NUDIX family)
MRVRYPNPLQRCHKCWRARMSSVKFCSNCGHAVVIRIPDGDQLPRAICPDCGFVHYENPRVVVGCVPEWQGRILLCRRAIEPRRGYWTAPAGFLEIGESLHSAAARETAEEALAEVEIGSLLSVVNVLHTAQVHVMFRGRLRDARHGAGAESLETGLYAEDEIPWNDIAFASVRFALERYFEDRRERVERMHFHDIVRSPAMPAPR